MQLESMPSRGNDGLERFTLVTHVVRKGDGQGRVNLEVVREALSQGVGVTLVCSEVAEDLLRDPLVRWHPIRVPRALPSLLAELWFSALSARVLRRLADGPLVSNGCITSVPARLNACHFVHSSWLRSPDHPGRLRGGVAGRYHLAYSALNARWERSAYAAAGTVVAVSRQVKDELAQIGIDPNKIIAVPNGVDSDEFRPRPPDREKFGLPTGVPLALFAGDIRSPRKNLDTVLKALVREPRLHLAVAGWLESSPFPQMARDLGLGDRVRFIGNCREMPLLMSSCDVFAFPSRYEACSLVMLEAMASALPVITSRTTGGAELVPDGGGFLLEHPDDVDGLVDVFRRVCDRPAELEEMSGKSRARGCELRWDSMARRYLDILRGA